MLADMKFKDYILHKYKETIKLHSAYARAATDPRIFHRHFELYVFMCSSSGLVKINHFVDQSLYAKHPLDPKFWHQL